MATKSERVKEILDQGVSATKVIAAKTSAKAKELGELGVLTLEIKQLQGQVNKLIGKLGTTAYSAFTEKGAKSITVDTPAVKALLAEIASVKEAIAAREEKVQVLKK